MRRRIESATSIFAVPSICGLQQLLVIAMDSFAIRVALINAHIEVWSVWSVYGLLAYTGRG